MKQKMFDTATFFMFLPHMRENNFKNQTIVKLSKG